MKSFIKTFESFYVDDKGEMKDAEGKFDFENFDNTDLAGPSIEMEIDELCARIGEDIKRVISNDSVMQKQAKIEIGRLWIDKIKEWAWADAGDIINR